MFLRWEPNKRDQVSAKLRSRTLVPYLQVLPYRVIAKQTDHIDIRSESGINRTTAYAAYAALPADVQILPLTYLKAGRMLDKKDPSMKSPNY